METKRIQRSAIIIEVLGTEPEPMRIDYMDRMKIRSMSITVLIAVDWTYCAYLGDWHISS